MNTIVFLVLRRMRRPLLALIAVYAIAVLGLVLIPGQDAVGNPVRLSFFHAFYIISYTATTIGFGEIPHAFTEGQRLWLILAMYASVIAWLYAIGNILALLGDHTFQQALTERVFTRRVRAFREPFYLVCGYGQTGMALVRALIERGRHAVVIDSDEERINLIKLQNLRESVLALHGNARKPTHLLEAGLEHSRCAGVVAVTADNDVNLKVAITAKLLHPQIRVICRADSHDVEANMASFGTDYIIDPFDTFAQYLARALQAPCLYLLQRWLTGEEMSELPEPIYPPTQGLWIVCGFGRFGKAVYQRLRKEGIRVVVVEAVPERTGVPSEGVVRGRGTEGATLIEAGVEQAVGLVAGTDDDTNNLSIIMTARELNSQLFVIARQNSRDNDSLFHAVRADMAMHPSTLIADKIRVLLATPMLYDFIGLSVHQDDAWACQLISRLSALVETRVPAVQEVDLGDRTLCAIESYLVQGRMIRVADLVRDPADRDRQLGIIVLMVERKNHRELLPDDHFQIRAGDRLLLSGRHAALDHLRWTLCHEATLEYLLTGQIQSRGWLWRKIGRWKRQRR